MTVKTALRLYYITDRRALEPHPLSERIAEAIAAGVDAIQIREKDLPARALAEITGRAVEDAHGKETRILINDRLDVAQALGAHGVHLGRQSLPARVVRAAVPADFLVGVSCHSLEEALEAEQAGANYVLLGPIFETPSKKAFGPPLGITKLAEATRRVKIPILALGGITLNDVRSCLDAGAAGIAGIRIFQDCDSLEARVKQLRATIASSAPQA